MLIFEINSIVMKPIRQHYSLSQAFTKLFFCFFFIFFFLFHSSTIIALFTVARFVLPTERVELGKNIIKDYFSVFNKIDLNEASERALAQEPINLSSLYIAFHFYWFLNL